MMTKTNRIFMFSTAPVILLTCIAMQVFAGTEGMPNMPLIQASKTYSIQSTDEGDQLQESRGYGDQEPAVRMMNLMMVSGSGVEGMVMDETKTAENAGTPKAGADGMQGMEMSGKPNGSKATKSSSDLVFDVKTTPSHPQVGSNLVEVNISKDQKPVKDLKLKAEVSMTTMDMGTDGAKVKEISPGKYQMKANFAMKGTWSIKLKLPSGEEKILPFNVESSAH